MAPLRRASPLCAGYSLRALGTPGLAGALTQQRAGLATTPGGAPPPTKWTAAWAYHHGREMLLHYYHGSKLLIADTKIAARLFGRLVKGHRLSRREHNLLVRVLADLSRVIPLAFFLLVPFMEFALPFALRLFPNLLPSTFEEKHQKEEKRKKLLQMRLEVAQVLEHTLEKRASEVRKSEAKACATVDAQEAAAQADRESDHVRAFMLRMRQGGRAASRDELLSVMSKFSDKITLDGLQRDQLVSMCNFLGLPHFAPTAVLRFQLRTRLRRLRNEDKEIMWEGVASLKDQELVADLRARGIPTQGLDAVAMRAAMSDWLVLSKSKEIAYSLLILTNMLRFAQLREQQAEQQQARQQKEAIDMAAAQAALSSITADTVESALSQAEPTPKEALEALRREEALVEEERQAKQMVASDINAAEDVADSATAAPDAAEQLSREQIENLVEAVQTMSAPTACAAEREEMRELEEVRQRNRPDIDEATKSSREIAMLDSRVTRMLAELRTELDLAEGDIGQAFRAIDLDGDGVMSHEEILQAMERIDPSKKPDEATLRRLLEQIDWDADGRISVEELKGALDEMQMGHHHGRDDDDDDDDDDASSSSKSAAAGAK